MAMLRQLTNRSSQRTFTITSLPIMNEQLEAIFARIRGTAGFADTDFSDVNATSCDGDNALHCVVGWGDVGAARALIDAGIDINKAGDLGYTPLHVACIKGNADIVKLLIDRGADMFALSEGDAPFTTARRAGHDHICDILAPLMTEAQKRDPKAWVRARIAQLRREISALEKKL
jgi:ankyrin repeat protein